MNCNALGTQSRPAPVDAFPLDTGALLSDDIAGFHAVRGGRWTQHPPDCRLARRILHAESNARNLSISFRLACSLPAAGARVRVG